jgi:hypothetical protein
VEGEVKYGPWRICSAALGGPTARDIAPRQRVGSNSSILFGKIYSPSSIIKIASLVQHLFLVSRFTHFVLFVLLLHLAFLLVTISDYYDLRMLLTPASSSEFCCYKYLAHKLASLVLHQYKLSAT